MNPVESEWKRGATRLNGFQRWRWLHERTNYKKIKLNFFKIDLKLSEGTRNFFYIISGISWAPKIICRRAWKDPTKRSSSPPTIIIIIVVEEALSEASSLIGYWWSEKYFVRPFNNSLRQGWHGNDVLYYSSTTTTSTTSPSSITTSSSSSTTATT